MESYRKCLSIIATLVLLAMLGEFRVAEAATMSTAFEAMSTDTGPLPPPIVTGNSVETCLNSRYSQHSLSGTASDNQISNVIWAAGQAPFTGTQRDIYLATEAATYLYDSNSHSLSFDSNDVRDDGAFVIIYESALDFDMGVSFMPALLASVSLCNSTESPVASCPKGIGYPKARLIFGVQSGRGLTTNLSVHCSVPEGEPGWLPDPSTVGDNSIEEVLGNLQYVSSFAQTNLTLQQISQILWAGYGCTAHTTSSGRAGLTVPSAYANYYLTQSIYLANENGVYRYHNRNPSTNLTTRDHRIEQINSADVRDSLQSAVSGLPQAPCYVILCLDSSYAGQEYAHLETGFVAGNMLIQATAIDLSCHFKTELTLGERSNIQGTTTIPSSHIPQAIVSIGLEDLIVDFSGNGIVNFKDYCILAQYWLQDESSVDIAPPPLGDGTVNLKDLAVFTDKWLTATGIPPLPSPATIPHPADGATNVDINYDLSWTAGADAESHDVYFGTSSPPPFIWNRTAKTFDTGTMDKGTMYFWRIDEVNAWGKTNGTLWYFTTTDR